jgi:hypothetical protein
MALVNILFFEANPYRDLDLNKEISEIENKLERATYRSDIKVELCLDAQVEDLINKISTKKPTVVHFSGHGQGTAREKEGETHRYLLVEGGEGAEGQLIFIGEDRTPRPLTQAMLVRTFKGRPGIRVVVLNACYTRAQAEAIGNHIDCVVGTTRAIKDEVAIVFSAQFYRSLGNGESVQRAYDDACAVSLKPGVGESELPILMNREGVDASKVFLIDPRSVPRQGWDIVISITIRTFREHRVAARLVIGSFAVMLLAGSLRYLLAPPDQPKFKDAYKDACDAVEARNEAVLKRVVKLYNKTVKWEGIVTSVSAGGGQILNFNVKPLEVDEQPKPCQKVTIYPANSLESTFFGKLPVKVRFEGEITTIDK